MNKDRKRLHDKESEISDELERLADEHPMFMVKSSDFDHPPLPVPVRSTTYTDYNEVQRVSQIDAEDVVEGIASLYFRPEEMEDRFLRTHIKVDANRLSKYMLRSEGLMIAVLRLLEEVEDGETAEKKIFGLATISKEAREGDKDLAGFIEHVQNKYEKLQSKFRIAREEMTTKKEFEENTEIVRSSVKAAIGQGAVLERIEARKKAKQRDLDAEMNEGRDEG
jgi:hypothetical protein